MSKKSKIIIIVSVIIGIIVIAALIVAAIIIVPKFMKGKEKQKLEWGDIYLEVLKDDDKLEDMDNQQIQLCDLDKDNIPELIIYGLKNASEYIANIYKINDKNEVDTIKVSLNEEFDLRLLYNAEIDDYVWYAVSKNPEERQVYDLNIETNTYTPQLIEDKVFEEDFVEVEENYSGKVDFNKEDSDKDKKDKLEQAKDQYVTTDEMITDEVKEKAEALKALKNVEKIDPSKDIVYSAVTYDASSTSQYLGKFEYPVININSEDVKKVNSEIKEKYGFKENDLKTQGYIIDIECEESGYFYNINNTILSLVVYYGGNDSVWATTYNIDLETLEVMTSDELVNKTGLDKNTIITKAKEAANQKFEDVWNNDKKENPALANMFSSGNINEWKKELENDIDNLTSIYLNENGDLCILGEVIHPGGQEHCWMTIIINVSQNYSVTELKLNVWDKTTRTTEPATTPTPSATPTPKPTTSSTQSSSSSSSGKVSDVKFATSPTTTVVEGTYKRGNDGSIVITNSKKGSFDFEINCTYMTAAGYPNMGMLSGTAKETSNGNFAYVEKKSKGDVYDYTVMFYIADGSIKIEDESETGISPYCGHNVTFRGTFVK